MSEAESGELAHIAWLGAASFLAFAFGLLYLTRRAAREHGALAFVALGQVLLHVAAVRCATADGLAEAAFAENLFLLAIGVTAVTALELVVSLDAVPARERLMGWSCAGLAVFAGATGLGVDASTPSAAWSGALTDAPPLAALTVAGRVALYVTMGALVMGTTRLLLTARRAPILRPTAVGSAIVLLPTIADSLEHLEGVIPLPFVHHARGLILLVLAATIVRRAAENEQALAKKSAEAGASATRLAVAQEELLRTQQLAAVGELSAVIAHEIRNPLAILRNAASGLRRDLAEADRQTLLVIVDEEVDRLDRLLDDLLVYARPLAPDSREVELTELVRHAVHLALEGQPTARDIDIDFDPDERVRSITGDPALLRHALINIVDNAILAMPRGGTISIRFRSTVIRRDIGGFAIDVRDEGEGMNTLVRSRAKDPFFTTRQTGTGLGLAIVERVARVHGGEVSFQSHGVEGTTVTLSLPAAARQSAVDLELQTGRFTAVSQLPDRPRP